MATPGVSRLDGSCARLTALAIAILSLGLMIWLGRNDVPILRTAIAGLTGVPQASNSGNPELDACLTKRVGDIDQLLAEGMIKDSQYPSFRRRATSYCETMFPAAN